MLRCGYTTYEIYHNVVLHQRKSIVEIVFCKQLELL